MIFDVLQQVLNEFFLNVEESNISLYAGDLFESSHFKLTDVFLKPSLINSLQLPFELSAGYIGNVTVEGLVGAVAGWPLEISISDLCFVLKPNHVKWENEQLIRYAKDLMVALCQCIGTPTAVKKDITSFTSPMKWIWSRIQPVKADTIIQLERIHLRVESPRSDCLTAYGLYIPLLRFAPREVEDQILHRRQHPGVTYPKASDKFLSKLLTIENVSLYADLDASPYWDTSINTNTTSATEENSIPAANFTSQESNTSLLQYTFENPLKRFKKRSLMPFNRAEHHEFIFARVVWIKLDFKRGQPNINSDCGSTRHVLTALDIATEAIELSINFDQIAVIFEEFERVLVYFKRARTWQWRPSCIDREYHTPPNVKVSASAFLPLTISDEEFAVMCYEKQIKSRTWFRSMWRYALQCIIEQQLRSEHDSGEDEKNSRIWWRFDYIVDKEFQENRRQRYMHLYARNLSPDAMEIALYGRRKAFLGLGLSQDQHDVAAKADKFQPSPPSPRRRPLPQFDALSHEELWELSDFVAVMSLNELRTCRALAEQQLRRNFTTAPPSPTRKGSSKMRNLKESSDFTSDQSVQHCRRYSVDSIPAALKYQPTNSAPDANVYCHRRESTIARSADAFTTRPASPTKSWPYSSSTSSPPSPTRHESAFNLRPFEQRIHTPQQISLPTTSRFEKQLFPAWILNPSRVVPLLNWHIGPVTIRQSVNANDVNCAQSVKIGIDGCSGAILFIKTPFLRIILEVRIGLLHVTLVRPPQLLNDLFSVELGLTEYKWISSNYIRSPEDGFLYIGLKYSAQEVASKRRQSDEEVSLKGRMCIGPITIECNEAATSALMSQPIRHDLHTSNLDFTTFTHFFLLQDACHNFIALLLKQKHSLKQKTSSRAKNKPSAPDGAYLDPRDQQKLKRKAKTTQLLHALLMRSLTFEIEFGTLELKLSANTSHVEGCLSSQYSRDVESFKAAQTCEEVDIRLQATVCRLQNRPTKDECIVDVAGLCVVYRSSQRGRAAVIRHLAQFVKL